MPTEMGAEELRAKVYEFTEYQTLRKLLVVAPNADTAKEGAHKEGDFRTWRCLGPALVLEHEREWVKVTPETMPEVDVPVLIWRFGFAGPNQRVEFAVVASLDYEEGAAYWVTPDGNDISGTCVLAWQPILAPAGGGDGR